MGTIRFGEVEAGEATTFRDVRQVVLPILVVSLEGEVHPVGTCFVVSCKGKTALALTARHVIEQMIHLDGAKPLSHSSTPEEFRIYHFHRQPVNTTMHVAYMTASGQFIPCRLVKTWFRPKGPDVAPILIRIPEDYQAEFRHRVSIHSRGPVPGDKVAAYGYSGMQTTGQEKTTDGVTIRQEVAIPLKHYVCEVSRCYGYGERRLVKWPCFDTTATSDPGMSGGPIAFAHDGDLIACGVVTSGSSFEPQGVGSKIYPALITRIEADFPFLSSKRPTLLECVRHGMIFDVCSGHKHILADGRWTDDELCGYLIDVSGIGAKEGGVVVQIEGLNETGPVPAWVSKECLALGKINASNGDEAFYFLISRLFREAGDAAEAKRERPSVTVLRAENPYIWLDIAGRRFRFFLFTVSVDGDASVKVLTDAWEEPVGILAQ